MSETYIELEDLREAIELLNWSSKNKDGVLVDTGAACEDEAYIKYTDLTKAIKNLAWHKGDSDIKVKSTIRFQVFKDIKQVNDAIQSEDGCDTFPGLHSADQIICINSGTIYNTIYWRVTE